MRILLRVVLVLAVSLSLSCSDDDPVEPQEVFSGILEVDELGNIVGGDTTDFQPRPLSAGGVPSNYSLIFAFPNPVTSGDVTRVRFQIPVADSVTLRFYDRPGAPPMGTLYQLQAPPGVHDIQWTGSGFEGIYRVEMITESGFRSFGDVEFQKDR